MEKTRQALESIGRMLFAQCTEIINPATNKGLPPNLVADEPSKTWLMKPVDITVAALQGELGFLAHPVNHVHSAEMNNQSIHSLALVSARYTHIALNVFSQLTAAYLFAICQVLNLRAMHIKYLAVLEPRFRNITTELLGPLFSPNAPNSPRDSPTPFLETMHQRNSTELQRLLDNTTSMDSHERFAVVARSLHPTIMQHMVSKNLREPAIVDSLPQLQVWTERCSALMLDIFIANRDHYSAHGDASNFLGMASKRMYTFIRQILKVPFLRERKLWTSEESRERMNPERSDAGLPNDTAATAGTDTDNGGTRADNIETPTLGDYITRIYKALRNGMLYEPAMNCLQEAQTAVVEKASLNKEEGAAKQRKRKYEDI